MRPLRVVVITQEDPFFLPDALRFLTSRLPENVEIVGAAILDVSPFGRRCSFLSKCLSTLRVFGIGFFLRYAFKYALLTLSGKCVKRVLEAAGIPVIQIHGSINSKESRERLEAFSPDVLVSIAGNQIFKRPLIELARFGVLNLHTANLPKYRGLMPSFWVLANREECTAVSVFFVDEGIDSGPILVQECLKICGRNQEDLIRDTKLLGMEAIRTALIKVADGGFTTFPNEASESTYYGFPTAEDVRRFRSVGAKFF